MALLNTDLLSVHDQTFRQDRYMHQSWLQEGVLGSGDFKVTPGGASLQWSVAAGDAWVQGDTNARQGLYHQVNDAAVTGLVAAGHATLPRIDQVILQIADSSETGVSDTPTLSTLAGTATSGATLDNRTGAADLPASALRLADILVPAAHSGVLVANTHIRDRRPWARGTNFVYERATGADYTTTSSSFADVDATNLKPRIECSGGLVIVTLDVGSVASTIAGDDLSIGLSIDGDTERERIIDMTGANAPYTPTLEWMVTPAAGSHVFAIRFKRTAGTGTNSIRGNATQPLYFSVRELVLQNTSNS
jgi:hypothetical protein